MKRSIEIMPDRPAIIHVNRQFIGMNAKDGGDRPVYTVKWRGETIYAREIDIEGRSKAVYNGNQLSCGARAWIEVSQGEIHLHDAQSFSQAKVAA
jgi:hypothetical protein